MLDTSYHRRRSSRRARDPEYRDEYERAGNEIDQVNSIIRALDEECDIAGVSKAEIARRIGRNSAVVRRLFTAEVNPELRLVTEVASALGVESTVVKKRKPRRKQPTTSAL